MGIIASQWKSNFNGNPYFLIDSKLFHGSSGSIVLSKPSNIVEYRGRIFHTEEKDYAFLGILSGSPYINQQILESGDLTIVKQQTFDLSIVWYSYLIAEIIKSGLHAD